MTIFKEFLSDPSGQLSMTRILSAIIVILTMGVWVISSIKTGAITDVPDNIMYINGSALLGKSIQKGFEK